MTDGGETLAIRTLAFEDLRVGQRFVGGTCRVDAEDVKAFASRSDPQPFHMDEEAAKGTFFAGLAASGWHTAAIAMRLLVDSLPLAGGIIGSGGELRWPKPVRPGDTLSVETEILRLTPSRSRPDRGTVDIRILTRNQHGEIVQSFEPKLLVMRRETTQASSP